MNYLPKVVWIWRNEPNGELVVSDETEIRPAGSPKYAILKNNILQINMMPPECAPKNTPVLVAGGIAMKKEDGRWYTGMEEPAFRRPIQWEVKWWAAIPNQNNDLEE